jgi:hypothetical protein
MSLGRCAATLTFLILALAATACASAPAKAHDPWAIALNGVGGFRLGVDPDTTYRQALRRFGPLQPGVSTTFPDGGYRCKIMVNRLRLTLTFASIAVPAKPASCQFFQDATVTGARWHTASGLRIGATLQRLKALYLNARDINRGDPSLRAGQPHWWWLTATHGAGRQPVLTASVEGGRVRSLSLSIVGN